MFGLCDKIKALQQHQERNKKNLYGSTHILPQESQYNKDTKKTLTLKPDLI